MPDTKHGCGLKEPDDWPLTLQPLLTLYFSAVESCQMSSLSLHLE